MFLFACCNVRAFIAFQERCSNKLLQQLASLEYWLLPTPSIHKIDILRGQIFRQQQIWTYVQRLRQKMELLNHPHYTVKWCASSEFSVQRIWKEHRKDQTGIVNLMFHAHCCSKLKERMQQLAKIGEFKTLRVNLRMAAGKTIVTNILNAIFRNLIRCKLPHDVAIDAGGQSAS